MVLNDKYVKLSDLMEYPIRLDHYDKKHGNEHFVLGIESILEYAGYYATNNVAEVKHGQWIEDGSGEIICSQCGTRIPEMYSNADSILQSECKFCHYCGAKMDGKKLLTWIPRDNWELGCEYECPYCGEIVDVPHGGIMPRKCWKCEKEIGVK